MGPATRSITANSQSHLSLEEIVKTKDPIQDHFTTPLFKIPLWRKAIFNAYASTSLPPGISLVWLDRDKDHHILNVSSPALPTELFETIVKLCSEGKTLLTITLFYTTGTVRVQGYCCSKWAEKEFIHLRETVHKMSLVNSPTQLDDSKDSNVDIQPSNSTSRSTPSLSEESEVKQIAIEPSPTLDRPCHVNSVNQSDDLETIVTEETTGNLHKKLKELDFTLAELKDFMISDHDAVMSVVLDLQKEVKELVKVNIRDLHEEITSTIESLTKRVETLELENQKLKSQVGEYKQTITALRKASNVNVFPAIDKTLNSVTFSSSTAQSHPAQANTPVARKSAPLTRNTPMAHPFSEKSPASTSATSKISTSVTPSKRTYSEVVASVSTSNHYQVLSQSDDDDDPKETMARPISSNTTTDDNSLDKGKTSERKPKSPTELMMLESIHSTTCSLLIGDSMIREINPKKLSPSIQMQKICIPGMTIDDLSKWLSSRTPTRNIISVTVHVGLNTCKRGIISRQTWANLLCLLRTTFPQADICMSSLLPAFGQHPANNVIHPSNFNLQAECEQGDAAYVDNIPVFQTISGAPRKQLYNSNDSFHPSRDGAARLACNIKYSFRCFSQDDPPHHSDMDMPRPAAPPHVTGPYSHTRNMHSGRHDYYSNSASGMGRSNNRQFISRQPSLPPVNNYNHLHPNDASMGVYNLQTDIRPPARRATRHMSSSSPVNCPSRRCAYDSNDIYYLNKLSPYYGTTQLYSANPQYFHGHTGQNEHFVRSNEMHGLCTLV